MSVRLVRAHSIPLLCILVLSAAVAFDASALRPRDALGVGGDGPQVVIDNLSSGGGLNASGASPAAQWDTTTPFHSGAADDFVLPASPLCVWSISRMTWTGRYWGDGVPGSISGFQILIWPDHDSMPAGGGALTPDDAQALATFTIPGNAGETANPGDADMFDYAASLDPPLELLPGTRYWVEVRAMADFPPQWGWQVTLQRTGMAPHHYFDLLDLRAWMPIADTGDLAFALYGTPITIDCDDQNACTVDTCDGGVCVNEPLSCDDGDACTDDACDPAGGCTHTTISCDDGDACTTDSCDAALGCRHDTVTCDDQSACTTDSCDPVDGCVYTTVSCDDGDACTTDSCDATEGCRHEAVTCDDQSACTTDACDPATGCTFTDISCDDGDPCTVDSCDPEGGCSHEPIVCDDESACTDDACVDGTCVFTPVSCDDGDACTEDTCDPASGCTSAPITCDDGDACTDDTCDPATGCQFTAVVCDDGDACTTDTCDPASGCSFEPVVCDDGNACTADECIDGTCTSGSPCDFDGDGDIDTADFAVLYGCMGSVGEAVSEVSCTCMDLNGDGTIDLRDFAVFQMEFNGAK